MDNSIFVLLGTVIGGLITVVVTLINNRKELAVKKTEYKLREKELEVAGKSEFKKEKIIRYSKFSGSLQIVLGFLGD